MPSPLGGYILFGNDRFCAKQAAQAVYEAAQQEECFLSDIQTDKSNCRWAIAIDANERTANRLYETAWEIWFKNRSTKGEDEEALQNEDHVRIAA